MYQQRTSSSISMTTFPKTTTYPRGVLKRTSISSMAPPEEYPESSYSSSMTYPKSCLKKTSISSLDSSDSPASTRSSSPSDDQGDYSRPPASRYQSSRAPSIYRRHRDCPPAFYYDGYIYADSPEALANWREIVDVDALREYEQPQTHRKRVSFSESDDVRVFGPYKPPLRKQAKRAASRFFKACGDAMRAEPYEPPMEFECCVRLARCKHTQWEEADEFLEDMMFF